MLNGELGVGMGVWGGVRVGVEVGGGGNVENYTTPLIIKAGLKLKK